MQKRKFNFQSGSVDLYLEGSFNDLNKIVESSGSVIITDENVYGAHEKKFKGYEVIVLKPGEKYKMQHDASSFSLTHAPRFPIQRRMDVA